jgi:hypothetical protein
MDPSDFLDGLDGADHIGTMIHDHQPGRGANGCRNVVGTYKAHAVEGNKGRLDSAIAHQMIDGTYHGVMFEI